MMIRLLLFLKVCLLNFVKLETEYPPFYAIKMGEDTNKFTIFEQDNCDQKLYQSRENKDTYLYPDGEDNSRWVISQDVKTKWNKKMQRHLIWNYTL